MTAYGNNIKLFISGGSHDEKISMRLEGFPVGEAVDDEELRAFLRRRSPGRNAYSTRRSEDDIPHFISGITDGITDGVIEAEIYNSSQNSADYNFQDTPRPSHADYAAVKKYGTVDLRGGGHFSGRLTAPYCVAGGICLQYLKRLGIDVFAHIYSIGDIADIPFDMADAGHRDMEILKGRDFSVLDENAGKQMQELIIRAAAEADSVGGIVECAVTGLPVGLGEHMFSSVEAAVAAAVFAVPAVKGIEFGSGFAGTRKRGSENNDPFYTDGKSIKTRTNNCGGILGGMTDGMPLIFRAAVKPTPSIAREQDTVSISRMENVKLKISGRHDPCIVPRAVPVFEAAAALAVTDLMLTKIKEEEHCHE